MEQQKARTKSKAEVLTPTWIVKKQNDEVEKDYQSEYLLSPPKLESRIFRFCISGMPPETLYQLEKYATKAKHDMSK